MIRSNQNALVKRIRRLKQKKYRRLESAAYVEGLRAVATAIEQGVSIEQLVYSERLMGSDFGRQLLTESELPCTELAPELLDKLSERENASGIGAIVAIAQPTIDELIVKHDSLFVALYNVADPGNLGTIIRTVDAVGADGVLLVGDTVDPYHPTAVKASMGALFSVPIVSLDDAELLTWAAAHGVRTMATSAHAAADYRQADYGRPLLLLMGSEREGLAAEIVERADETVAIPMRGVASSLNLAVATALLLYEARRTLV